MKKGIIGSAALFVFVLAALPASFATSQDKSSAISEEAGTRQTIAPYRTWGKANRKPIILSIDQTAFAG